ncbi:hypothetical protein [Pinirhizobacter sp.]|jgi:hypothetical protein|uniref:hypothetical protein n=1 Tax=Pinirhizobacter sp. TaxID=2950432 RepID=UPI002F3F686D
MQVTDESELYALVGEVMVMSARVESCLESCIAACLPHVNVDYSQTVLRRLKFTSQLATLHEVSQLLYDRHDPILVEFRRWLRRLGRIRRRRNDLVHNVLRVACSPEELGRWQSEIGHMREICDDAPAWVIVLELRVKALDGQVQVPAVPPIRAIENVEVSAR